MCDCGSRVNSLLADYNTELLPSLTAEDGKWVTRYSVETCKLDEKKRGKPKRIFATFCPFCGERYK